MGTAKLTKITILLILILSVLVLLVGGCKPKISTTNPILVDYKSDTYKISLGENYKNNHSIDWQWAALMDDDGVIDSLGKDVFMSTNETLISYNGGEWLPAIFIETDKNIIMSFTCSILFDSEKNENSIEDFLNQISKDIKKLQIDTVKKSIILNGIFETATENYIETHKLTKKGKSSYDLFEYSIKINSQ